MSRGTQEPPVPLSISDTGLSPSMVRLSSLFSYLITDHVNGGPTTPYPRKDMVWAASRSLAATWEITFVFFS